MSIDAKIHEAQVKILRDLLFQPEATFSSLQKVTKLEGDHFKFHLSRLVELGYVEKVNSGAYKLSIKGKEYANKLDTDENAIERQPKLSVLIIAWRPRQNTQDTEFLVQQRLKNPYYGYFARLGGKIRWGETVLEAAARELLEETGLTGDLEYRGLYHKMDYNKQTDEMLEDKFFLLVKATNLTGELVENFEGGRNVWLTEEELDEQEKVFQGIRETYGYVTARGLTFTEHQLFYDPEDY